jgi:hypothetical protein
MPRSEAWVCIFIIAVFGCMFAVLVGIWTWRAEDARREACSYACNLRHGRWPAKVEWKGRDAAGHIKCECFTAERK